MVLSAGDQVDGDVVGAESWVGVNLLALAHLLPETKLALFVRPPGEDLSELFLKGPSFELDAPLRLS